MGQTLTVPMLVGGLWLVLTANKRQIGVAPSIEQDETHGFRFGQQDLGEVPARHIGKRVRVAGLTGRLLSIADGAWEGPNLVALAVVIRVTDMRTRDVLVGVNAECEVLP